MCLSSSDDRVQKLRSTVPVTTPVSDDLNVAIVLPFIKSQTDRLRSAMSLWSSTSLALLPGFRSQDACALDADGNIANPDLPSYTLIWYYDKNLDDPEDTESRDEILNATQEAFDALGSVKRCFRGGVRVVSADLEPAANKHPCGPCAMFYGLFDRLTEFSYFMLVEPDVTPIREHWLDALGAELQISTPGQDFWIKGSVPRCMGSYGRIAQRNDLHLNGNGIFKLNDPGFNDYLERVKAFYPGGPDGCAGGCSTGFEYENGHDHAIFRFRQHPFNFEYVKNVQHRFQSTPFIINLCEDPYDYQTVHAEFPSTSLIHSKRPLLDDAAKAVTEAYWDVFGKFNVDAGFTKQNMLAASIREGNMTINDLYVSLCASQVSLKAKSKAKTQRAPRKCLEMCGKALYEKRVQQSICGGSYDAIKRWRSFEPGKPYVWTSDFHAAPFATNQEIYVDAGAVLHAEIDFPNCQFFPGTCKQRLKVLSNDDWRGFGLGNCPNDMRRRFFDAYKDDPEFKRVDAFICSHPVANCELYMPFNRSIIVYATTRAEFGRFDDVVAWRQKDINARSPFRWEEWVQNLRLIAATPGNIVAANSVYDVQYIKKMAGVDARYIPSWGGDKSDALYRPRGATSKVVLLGPYRDNLGFPYRSERQAWNLPIFRELRDAAEKSGTMFDFRRFAAAYPSTYTWTEITSHPAIVLVPYQASFMSFFEYYRAGIPLFVPSRELLLKWHTRINVSWERVYGHPPSRPGDFALEVRDVPDPNSDSPESFDYWMQFSDVYHFPHITYFDSWSDLIEKLEETDFQSISEKMLAYSTQQREELVRTWEDIFKEAAGGNEPGSRIMPSDFDAAMEKLYGLPTLGPDPPMDGVVCPSALIDQERLGVGVPHR